MTTTTIQDLSIIELAEDATANIHTDVYVDDTLVAVVNAKITVLTAEDGHVSLAVDQETILTDDVHVLPPVRSLMG